MNQNKFQYDQVSPSIEEPVSSEGLKLVRNNSEVLHQFLNQRSKCKIWKKIFVAIIVISLIFAVNIYYSIQLRVCQYDSQHSCLSLFFLDDITTFGALIKMSILSLIFALLMFISVMNFINRKWLYFIVTDFVLIIYYYHQDASYFNFSYLYSYLMINFTIISLVWIYSLYGLFKLGAFSYKRKLILPYLLSVFLVSSMIYLRIDHDLKPNRYWYEGVMGKKVQDHTEDGDQYCKLAIPKYDWRNYFDGKVDVAYHYIDCTKTEFLEHDTSRDMLRSSIPSFENERYIAFPLLNQLQNPFGREETQDYITQHVKVTNNLEKIPAETEYVLDTQTMTYSIIVHRNEQLIKQRAVKHKNFTENLSKVSKERKPFKNMIVIYIDALSRIALAKKMPKFFNWFEEYYKRNEQDTTIFQGMRAHSIATFTYHNVLAYYYGARGKSGNVFQNSPFSMTDGSTNIEETEWINPKTGMTEIKKDLAGGWYYKNFLSDLKEAGYITGQTSTDCATTPLTQEGLTIKDFLEPIIYDHMGITHACDPNYFLPSYRTSSGGGPYSIYRRCLYGIELIDYTTNYAKQFLTQYQDQPKFISMEYLEAHERNQEVITYQDEKFYNFLNWLEMNGHLEDSILMFVSDHGMHMTSIIETPLLSPNILNPDNGFPIQIMLVNNKLLENEDRINLLKNEQKLTSMFEIFYFIQYLSSTEKVEFNRNNSLVSGIIPYDRSSFDLPDIESNPRICYRQRKKKHSN